MEFLLEIITLLFAAKMGGYLFKKINQPAILGEIIAGVIIGSTIFISFQPSEITKTFADIGIMMLMFLIGLEFNLKRFKKYLTMGVSTAILGAFLPFFAGIFISSQFLGWSSLQSFLLGLALMATSVSITAATFGELKKTKTREFSVLLDAAVIDDIIGVAALAFFLGIANGGTVNVWNLFMLGGKLILFFAIVLSIGPYVGKYFVRIGKEFHLRVEEGQLSFILILLFGLGILSKSMGLSLIIGAFLAGVILDKKKLFHVEHEIYGMTYGLFVPIFFVFMGTYLNLEVFYSHILVVLLIFFVAIFTKLFGAAFGAKLSGLNPKSSLIVGIGMMPRGEVALIILSLGLSTGVLTDTIYSIILAALMLTILVTPPLLKFIEK